MLKQEAETRAVTLRAEMRKVFGKPGERILGGGARVIASAGAFQEAVKYPTSKPFYRDRDSWTVLATLGWKATRNGKAYGDWIFLEPDAVPQSSEAGDSLIEVLQIQMEQSLATVD